MAEAADPDALSPEAAQRFVDFARACKAAARIVTLYPAAHPAISASLGRIVELSNRATAEGPLRLTVLVDSMLIGGRMIAKPDPAIGELALLLHAHLVGELTVHSGADLESWRSFLLLLGRAPADVRAEGGIHRLWSTLGGRHVELREIDYREVLKERQGTQRADWDKIIANCLKGDAIDLDEKTLQALMEIVGNPERLAELATMLCSQEATGGGVRARTGALVRMLRSVAEAVARKQPDKLSPTLDNMAVAIGKLSADALLGLISNRSEGATSAPTVDVVGGILERMTDGTIAQFIARSVIAEGGATERLVTAFHALVPEADRQEPVLGLARDEAATSALGTDPGFKGMWDNVVDMLTSYSDRSFVSDAYGKELSGARIQAMEVERVSDDPPERIAVWLGSVTDGRVRALDLQLLLDLLRIEKDEHRWDDMTIPTVAHIEDLLLMGDFEAAQGLVDVLAFEAGAEGSDLRKRSATRALDRLVNGQMMQHTVSHLRSLDELGFNQVKKLYYTLGANVIKPLTEALALEEQPRPREQLTEILIGFGALGRQSVERLKNSPNAAVRRTAVRLLREFGGQEALPELTALLDDAEPRVQREAIRAILNIATDQAYAVLKTALESGTAASRELIMQSISGLRDERAAPLFCYIIRNVDHRGRARQVYQRAIEALGAQSENDDESVEVLKEALYRGEWWAPFRTAALRLAAAAALARIGTPAALDVLREAGQLGSHGVRTAARRQLASDDRNQHAPAEEGTRPA